MFVKMPDLHPFTKVKKYLILWELFGGKTITVIERKSLIGYVSLKQVSRERVNDICQMTHDGVS